MQTSGFLALLVSATTFCSSVAENGCLTCSAYAQGADEARSASCMPDPNDVHRPYRLQGQILQELMREGDRKAFVEELEQGANPNDFAGNGLNATIEASRHDGMFLCDALRFGGDPNLADATEVHYPLREALLRGIESGNWFNFFLLLDFGADLNFKPAKGRPIAEEAVALGKPGLAIILLERGYSSDLDGLLATSKVRRFAPGSEAFADNLKLQDMLKKHIDKE